MTAQALSSSKWVATAGSASRGGEWFRLSRTSDGVLCLESISDASLHRSGSPADWAFCGEVPRHIAKQLDDRKGSPAWDLDPDQVAKVLDRAIRVLGYTQ
jgi:hypothetical protein